MKKVIEKLESAKGGIEEAQEFLSRETIKDMLIVVNGIIEEAIAYLKSPPRWETTEQYEKRTGEKWPDNGAVFTRLKNKHDDWDVHFYGRHKQSVDFIERMGGTVQPLYIVCATEAGLPPDDWKPEDES
jgi:hypothetical protein